MWLNLIILDFLKILAVYLQRIIWLYAEIHGVMICFRCVVDLCTILRSLFNV